MRSQEGIIKKVKILGSTMCRILNRIMCMILTESNVNSVEMRTEEFLVKENRMRASVNSINEIVS